MSSYFKVKLKETIEVIHSFYDSNVNLTWTNYVTVKKSATVTVFTEKK